MKEIKVKVGEKEVTIRELSLIGHFKLKSLRIEKGKIEFSDYLPLCIDEKDLKYLETTSWTTDKSSADNLIDAIIEVMEFNKKEGDASDFQKQA